MMSLYDSASHSPFLYKLDNSPLFQNKKILILLSQPCHIIQCREAGG